MFDIAFSELIVVALIALVILGPKRLPEMARAAGRWTARIRRFIDDAKRDVHNELRREELAELRQVHQQLTDTKQLFENTAHNAFAGITDNPVSETLPDYQVKALPDAATPRTPKKRATKARPAAAARPKTRKTARSHVRTSRKPKS